MTPELKPCCAGTDCKPTTEFNNKDRLYYVWCEDHEWYGPSRETPEEAHYAWNTRTTPPTAKAIEECAEEIEKEQNILQRLLFKAEIQSIISCHFGPSTRKERE